jgi:hypothetical protein
MNKKRSPSTTLLLSAACVVLVLLLAYSMPNGPPPRQPDGSIAITTMYRYEQQAWKVYPIFGFGTAALVFLAIGCWQLVRRKATGS